MAMNMIKEAGLMKQNEDFEKEIQVEMTNASQ